MADSKISALPSATTPLTGSEIVPIVQSGVTDQVSVANLTAGRATSVLSLTSTNDSTINGMTVGLGAGAVTTNTAIGYEALYSNSTGAYCVAVGYGALLYSTGSNNTGVGYKSLFGASTFSGTNNTAIGYATGYQLTTGSNNTLIGLEAGNPLTTGSHNIMIGYYSGNGSANTTTGSYNILIGEGINTNGASDTNSIAIGNNNSTGGIYAKGSNTAFISPNGGNIYNGGNTSAWQTTSDNRLKKNITDYSGGLANILKLQVRNFEYRLPTEVDSTLKPTDAINITGTQIGFIAQEFQTVYPNSVTTESTGVLAITHDNTQYDVIQAIQQLNATITALQTQVTSLQTQVTALTPKV